MGYLLIQTAASSDVTRSEIFHIVVKSLSNRMPDDEGCPLFDPAASLSVLLKTECVFTRTIYERRWWHDL